MLNRVESRIMEYLFKRCRGKRTVLIAPQEILDDIGTARKKKRFDGAAKYEITKKQLEVHMKNIVLDGYVDYSNSDNKGSMFYVVTLTTRGEAFQREHEERVKRRFIDIGWRIVLASVGAVVGVVIGFILKG